MTAKKPSISIKPSKQGSLRAKAGVKAGQKIPVVKLQQLKKSSSATTRRQANFALNARKWNSK